MAHAPNFDWHGFVRDAATAPQQAPALSTQRRVVRADSLALRPPQRLPRRVDTPWSAYTMTFGGGTRGRRVAVPHAAIMRIYPSFESPPFGVCARCPPSECTCSHGWSLPDARSIVVLKVRARNTLASESYGWFVRYESDPTHLVRVPTNIVRLVVAHHCTDATLMPAFAVATLLMLCQPSEANDFCAQAADQFVLQRARIAVCEEEEEEENYVVRQKLKRKRAHDDDDGASTSEAAEAWQTCCVCLETAADAVGRCARGTCQTAVCTSCHDSLRGLCPICDRGANDALFQCAACDEPHPLRRSGFPCLGCKRNTVCRSCYKVYAACRECV